MQSEGLEGKEGMERPKLMEAMQGMEGMEGREIERKGGKKWKQCAAAASVRRLRHSSFSHTTLSPPTCVPHNPFTHISFTHNSSIHNYLTHNFVTHNSFTHTTLSHMRNFVPHNRSHQLYASLYLCISVSLYPCIPRSPPLSLCLFHFLDLVSFPPSIHLSILYQFTTQDPS